MRLSFLAMIVCGSVTSAQGKVWVVDDDGGPGVDFTEVQSAVDAAADGDVVLIEDGSYVAVTVSGKGLTLAGEEDAQVLVGRLNVAGLGANQSFVARDLTIGTSSVVIGRGEHLLLPDNSGPILFEECSIGTLLTLDTRGATVDACASVVFVHSELHGSPGVSGLIGQARPGLVITTSSVHLFFCDVRGGRGKDGDTGDVDGKGGATGISITGGFLYLGGATVEGGAGGDAFFLSCGFGGNGGFGLAIGDAASVVRILDSTLVGGSGGSLGPGPCPVPGSQAPPVSDFFGADLTTLPGLARSMQSESPVREGQVATSTYFGQPGDFVFGSWGIAQNHVYWEVFGGTSLPVTLASVFLGVVPPSGSFSFGLPLGNLAPGVDSLKIFSQIMILPQGSPLILGNPTAVVILDESF